MARVITQAANLRGFHASVNPRFEAGIPDFMNGILNFSIHFNVVHRKVDWRNPKMKSLNSMPEYVIAGGRGEATLLWHTPAHARVGNFKGEFTGLEKRRFTHLFCDTCCAGIRAGKFRNGHQVELRVHANNQQVAL